MLTKTGIGAIFIAACYCVGMISSSSAVPEDPNLAALKKGNADYRSGHFTNQVKRSTAAVRTDLATNGQHPKTIILTCADSRVPPEIIFNKGLGELFIIRVAGNVVSAYELASIEYGVEHLGAKQIVVLGHSKCGAVKEAFNNYTALRSFRSLAGKPGFSNLSSLVNAIRPAVAAADRDHNRPISELWEASIDENVKLVKEQLVSGSSILEEKINASQPEVKVTLIGAKYDISAGTVSWLFQPL